MAQTTKDIILRAAYEVKDETFTLIKAQSALLDLDRVFRKYCLITKALTGTVGFYGDGNSMDFPLYGPVFDVNSNPLGYNFGDNAFQFYRVEINGKRGNERDFETIMNARIYGVSNLVGTSHPDQHSYCVKLLGKYIQFYLTYVLPTTSLVQLWYYEYPRLGYLSTIGQSLPINDRDTDDLVVGLAAMMWRRLVQIYYKQGNKDLAKFAADNYQLVNDEWNKIMTDRKTRVASYGEEMTPIVGMVVPDEVDAMDADLIETNYNSYD